MEVSKKLIKQAIKGNMKAFETLILQFEKPVYNLVFQMMGNEQDALDVTQEVFIKLYRSIGKFRFKSKFSTWVYRVAVNTCIDELRKLKKYEKKLDYIDQAYESEEKSYKKQYVDKGKTPEEVAIQNENVTEIRYSINQLKEDYRTIIILRDIKNFSYEEIAKILDCTLGTVKSRLSRARQQLKKEIVKKREQSQTSFV